MTSFIFQVLKFQPVMPAKVVKVRPLTSRNVGLNRSGMFLVRAGLSSLGSLTSKVSAICVNLSPDETSREQAVNEVSSRTSLRLFLVLVRVTAIGIPSH